MFRLALSILALVLSTAFYLHFAPVTVNLGGNTDIEMLRDVQAALDTANNRGTRKLVLNIVSPGGPVLTSLEIARIIREASDRGLIVEIHAKVLCASGCTFVLASGTPGYRFIGKYTVFLVHSMQTGGGFAPLTCVSKVDDPKTQDDKMTNVLLQLMRDAYMRYTGASAEDANKWITCGNEQAGTGPAAVGMGLADHVE